MEAARTPFRLDASVAEILGETGYVEPEVADRELEQFEALQEWQHEIPADRFADGEEPERTGPEDWGSAADGKDPRNLEDEGLDSFEAYEHNETEGILESTATEWFSRSEPLGELEQYEDFEDLGGSEYAAGLVDVDDLEDLDGSEDFERNGDSEALATSEIGSAHAVLDSHSVRFPSGNSLPIVSGSTGRGEEHWDPIGPGLPLLATGPAVSRLKLSDHFTAGELVSSGGRTADVARIDPALVAGLEAMRVRVGRPIRITSGYRSWARNKAVYERRGKAPTLSRHCAGQAADIAIAGMNGGDIAELAIDAIGTDIGIGVGDDFAHIDVRGVWTIWNYGGVAEWAAVKHRIEAHRRTKTTAQPAVSPPRQAQPSPTPATAGSAPAKPVTLRLPSTTSEGAEIREELSRRFRSGSRRVTFEHNGIKVVVFHDPRVFVVSRGDDETFTAAAVRAMSPPRGTAIINGPLYEKTVNVGWGLTGPADRSERRTQGLVFSGGRIVEGRPSPLMYHFAWAPRSGPTPDAGRLAASWTFGPGDPPAGTRVGSGGGIPLIVNGLPFGVRNVYAPGAPGGLPSTDDPGAVGRPFLRQRSNGAFLDTQEKRSVGKPVLAHETRSGLTYMIVQEHGMTGMTLSEIRDALLRLGVDNALSWDGSDSATLVLDGKVVIEPARRKNNVIPVGFGLVSTR